MSFFGELNSWEPKIIEAGFPIELVVDWTVSTDSWVEVMNGWDAHVIVQLNGFSGAMYHGIYLASAWTFRDSIIVGPEAMPNRNLNGTVSLYCNVGGAFPGEDILVSKTNITLKVKGGGGVNGNGNWLSKNIIPITFAGGSALILIAAVTKPKKK